MSAGPITEADLQAYVDERLDAARRVEVEAWLAARPDEAQRIDDYRRLGVELRGLYEPVLLEPVPSALAHALSPGRRRWARVAAIAAWTALGALIGGFAGWELHGERQVVAATPEIGAMMARRAALAHATYSPEVRHPVEVGADQEAHLVAWLSKRLGAPLRAPKLEAVGYSLVGGRLLPGDTGPVAHFMYQCNRGTRVTLYVRNDMASTRSTAFRYSREGAVDVFYWVDSKVGYALSSGDISKENLLNVANAAYQQLNPP